MTPTFELRTITPEAVGRAAEKAEHYRLLNDPEQAESICLDVLAVEPENERALVTLILAMTDQFGGHGPTPSARKTRQYVSRLANDYQRLYYEGIVAERQARALLGGMSARFAYDGFRHAMELFERAMKIRPPGNDDAILRWNSCARTVERERLEPDRDEGELPLE